MIRELTPTQRGAYLTLMLMRGRRIEIEAEARAMGVTPRTVERTLERISLIVPIDEAERGVWVPVGTDVPVIQ